MLLYVLRLADGCVEEITGTVYLKLAHETQIRGLFLSFEVCTVIHSSPHRVCGVSIVCIVRSLLCVLTPAPQGREFSRHRKGKHTDIKRHIYFTVAKTIAGRFAYAERSVCNSLSRHTALSTHRLQLDAH